MEVDHSSNVERLEFLYLNMVGQVVQVHTIDGCVSEGIFVSRTDPETPENEAGIFLSFPRFLQSVHHKALDPSEFSTDARLFFYKDIVMMDVVHLKLRTETPGMGNVHCYRGEHDLKTLDWAEECAAELLETEKMSPGGWDQFKANERFGVTSTYKEDFYTTKLDRAKLTKEQLEYADRVAKAIENSATRGVQHQAEREEIAAIDLDEGVLFSDVIRENVPRGGKKGSGGTITQQQQQQSIPKTAPEPPTGKVMAAKRGTVDDGAPAPIEGGQIKDFNPNPAAAPFVPTRPIIRDYLRCIADAININDECYASDPDWPGEEDHYDRDDSSYSHQHPHHNQGPTHHHHHHHHQQQQQQQAQQQQQQPPPQQQQQQQQMSQAQGRGVPPQGQFMGMSGKGYGPMAHSFNRGGGHPVMHHQHHMPHHQYDMGNANNAGSYMVGGNTQVQVQQQQQTYVDQNMMGPSSSRMGTTMQQQRSSNKGTQPQQPVVTALPMQNTNNAGGGRVQTMTLGQPPSGGMQEIDNNAGGAALPEKQPPKKLRRGGASGGMAPRNDAAEGGQGVKKK
ncbi:unnamed protein product [Phytomonas sp. Hart1]|nr:unnamed protein product [Phytomonas sp. Hart1]|eukprot:CCW71358.1 unnamed protein product [Phytomonas sp. isolate Hart1]